MYKIIFTLILVLTSSVIVLAQEEEKIKGDRNVTIKQTYIDPFTKIVVGEEFTVEIIYNSKPSVEIETDDNLHQYIEFGVNAGVLTFRTTKHITSSKKMNIKVNYTDGFESIETLENGEIRSLTSLEMTTATLKTSGSSRAYLNIRTANFNFSSSEKAKSKLNVHATENATVVLSDDSKVEALLNAKKIKIDLYQNASANIEGLTETLDLRCDLSTSFTGKELASTTCNLSVEGNSSASVRANNTLIADISGNSEVYFYGSAKITLNTFLDSAKLQKKED